MSLRPDITKISKLQYASAIRWGITAISLPTGISGITSDDINTRCYSSTYPKTTTEEAQVDNRGTVIWQPGITRYPGTITLGFHEAEDGKMAEFIDQWRQLTWTDETGAAAPASNLKATFKLSLLTSTDAEREAYMLYGCWLKDWDGTELTSTGSDTIKFNITLQYDYHVKM